MAKKAKANLELAVINTTPDALSMIRQELKNLIEITETQYKTGSDGKVTGFPLCIQNETSVDTLVKMHSSVIAREGHYNNSVSRLSDIIGQAVSVPVFKDNGASAESIEQDIALRIKVLKVSDRKTELEGLLKEAEQFLTKEDQFKMFKQKLAASLNMQL